MAEPLMLSLVIIFAAITVIPLLAKRIRLPVIVIEIIFGIMLGKSLLGIIPDHSIIDFFSSFGLVYLMFLAGLEVNFEKVRTYFSKTILITAFSVAVPFIAGVLLSAYVGVHPLLLGTIFSTTSLGLVLPLTRELKYRGEFLHILMSSVVLVDILSLFMLGFSITFIQGLLGISFIYSLLAVLLMFLLPWLIKKWKIRERIAHWESDKSHFDLEVRFSFALILVLGAISGELGFHTIIGAFVAGLIISELTPTASVLENKLESFGYGFFIPLFFIFMGANVDLPLLFSNLGGIVMLAAIITVGILAKTFGAGIVARIAGFSWRESIAMGLFHSARLSLIIAAVEIGRRVGLISDSLFTAFVILAIVSAILGPSLGKYILLKRKPEGEKNLDSTFAG